MTERLSLARPPCVTPESASREWVAGDEARRPHYEGCLLPNVRWPATQQH